MVDRETLEYLVRLGEDQESVIGVGGLDYWKDRHELIRGPQFPTFEVGTLQGLVDYLDWARKDGGELTQSDMVLKLDSIYQVSLTGQPEGQAMQRQTYAQAEWDGNERRQHRGQSVEEFIIALETEFASTEDRDILIGFLAKVNVEDGVQFEDDGISQKVTRRVGVAGNEFATVPRYVALAPYKTFREIEPVEIKYKFRMSQEADCSLYEADGGQWEIDTRKAIADWLDGQATGLAVLA